MIIFIIVIFAIGFVAGKYSQHDKPIIINLRKWI
jgi:hypothetical protein